MNYQKLYDQLRIDEGVRYTRYLDTADPPRFTIGVGHNITDDPNYPYSQADEPLSPSQVNLLLARDVGRAVSDLDQNCNWWRACPSDIQFVLANMCFQLGWGGLSKFVNTLNAIHFSDYKSAASGMRASKWYSQCKNRAERLAKIIESQT